MEIILVIGGMWLFIWIVGVIINALSKTTHAVKETVKGSGSLKSNMKLNFQGLGSFELRMVEKKVDEKPDSPIFKSIECKGLFPISYAKSRTKLGVVVQVFDNTTGTPQPMVSMLENFQEDGSVIFKSKNTIGEVSATQGFLEWVNVGAIFPDFLLPPQDGVRNLQVYVQVRDLNYSTLFDSAYQTEKREILWEETFNFTWDYKGVKGYEEASANREEATSIALKIGVAVAMADNSLDENEGMVLKGWILRHITPFKGEKKLSLKKRYNDAMSSAFKKAKAGNLALGNLTDRLNDIGEKVNKYEALELAYDVMAADGVAESEELKIIKRIAKDLDLNIDEVNTLRDKKLIGLDTNSSNGASIEEILGISADWNQDKVKAHLRSEFNKWNNRLNTLPEGPKRDNAQNMLDMISEARNKYG